MKRISNLKRMRVMKRLRQEDLAKRSGVPVKCIGNYEQFRRDINHARFITVYKLAQGLGCDVMDIVEKNELYIIANINKEILKFLCRLLL